jgi:threonine dehydrogenase-like Zn-dependent dehydrogenase
VDVRFEACEYHADGTLRPSAWRFLGSAESGWTVWRNDAPWRSLPAGYRLLRTLECGVCATDLVRRYLPFPLPQIIGHEVLAADEHGRRCVIEINASHAARGVRADCPFCAHGLATHCPDRLVLGIHDLPGGFGPFVLAPVAAVLPVPDALPSSTAVLIEPFAAALHAIATIAPRAGDRIAVLGPRRLGMLVIAALAAERARSGRAFEIVALARRPAMLALARELGATSALEVRGDGAELPSASADVVIDTTGAPAGLELALRLARREVHLKSTHGQRAAGIAHPTEMVVDELCVAPFGPPPPALRAGARPRIAWLAGGAPPPGLEAAAEVLRARDAAALLDQLEAGPRGALPRVDGAVVATAEQLDLAVRPEREREISPVRPRGTIQVLPGAPSPAPLLRAVAERGLRVSTSRCGSFADALALLSARPELRDLGRRLVTHRFAAADVADALAAAARPECIKAVVEQPGPSSAPLR